MQYVFKAHSDSHPLKRGGTYGVRGHTWNQGNETPGRGGGVRKTNNKKNISSKMKNSASLNINLV